MSSLVPEGWKIKTLSDVTHNLDGKRVPLKSTDRGLRQGQYRYFGASGVIDYVDDYIFDGEYILLGEDGENVISRVLPLAFKVSGQFWVNNHAHVMQPTSGNDIGYICEFLESLDYSIIASGSAQPKVTQGELKKVKVHIPPLPEQQKIAKILTSVDDVIEKTQAQIDKLKDLKTGMMQELLTNGIGHTKFKDSPVGRIPAAWEACQMRDVCLTKQGLQIPISERYSEPAKNRYVYLTIRFINTGFAPSVAEYIENPSERVVCDESDIILARTGATGKVVTGVKGVFHNNFFKVDYEREKIHKNYFVHYLNSPFIQTEIKNRAGTTTIPDLNHGDFYSMPLLLPKFKEQIKISEVLDANDNLIDINYKKLNILKSQKKALMQDLLTGKVRVKVESTS